ncbi:N-acetylglucosamine kinase [Pseudalkalibacillus sp. Hm43]|uniref:N-acetylglucosamine kinase n=1 Tax=Pseudalkalibacillus sp. Hm43 TaxID=3450742 RepID=UPI003F42340D
MYLGIDGGGSKTRIALADASGKIVADFVGGPSNPLSVSMEMIQNTLDDLLQQIETVVDLSEIVSICAGIAGLENSHSKDELDAYLKSNFSEHTNVELCHDALTALYSGTDGEPGIVNIAGTGSITFGLTDELEMVRSGGWGYLLDHTGSGYGIGRAALQKVFESYDGMVGETTLTERILTRFEVSRPPELIPYIYNHPDSRTNIASICEEVFQLMREGDGHAMQIIEKAAFDISKCIRNLIERHFKNRSEIKVVLTGSVFRSCDLILPMLERHVPGEVEFLLPKSPPVSGSIIQSYQTVNGKCPVEFTRNLHANLKEV